MTWVRLLRVKLQARACCPFCCPSLPKQHYKTPCNDQQAHTFLNNIRRAGQITNRLLYQLSYVGLDFILSFTESNRQIRRDSNPNSPQRHGVTENTKMDLTDHPS
jgi:hypothetical protein